MPVLPVPAIAAANTLLFLGTDASPSVFSTNVSRLGGVKMNSSTAVVDVTNQESSKRRKLATLFDAGTLTADLYWEPTNVADEALLQLYFTAPPVLRSWKVEWPDGGIWLFNAYITKFQPDSPIAGALKCNFELTIDDGITVA